MAGHSRYNVGGEEKILKNKFGITDPKKIEDTETLLLSDAYNHFLEKTEHDNFVFSTDLLFEIHTYFLSSLYSWAGKIRTVEISKGGILFAASSQISHALNYFKKILTQNIPTSNDDKKKIAKKLALLHCEFNAVHPFREGNGRTIRLFLDLIAVHIGFELIDFGKTKNTDYIQACIAGMKKDYHPMQKVIYRGLKKRK